MLAVLLIVALVFMGGASSAAREVTPVPVRFAGTMGLPELRVQITDRAFQRLPAETPAGETW